MKNNTPKTINRQQPNLKKLLQLQPLQLEELESLAGGVEEGQGTVECPPCVWNPHPF